MKLTHLLAPLLLATAAAFAQGPLAPSGAPAPTMKSLDQIFTEASAASAKAEKRTPISALPFAITQPGSYYLTGNLTMTTAAAGIEISAVGSVTLDLNGFTLHGGGIGTTGLHLTSNTPLSVRNGNILGWTGYAIGDSVAASTVLSELTLDSAYGVVLGNDCTVQKCTIKQTVSFGAALTAVIGLVVSDCHISTAANGYGILATTADIRHCTVTELSAVSGGIGIGLGSRSSITDTQVRGYGTGIQVSADGHLERVTVTGLETGVSMGNGSSISNCSILAGSPTGSSITVGGNSVVKSTSIAGSVGAPGIRSTGINVRVSDCATTTSSPGISLGGGSIVTGCTVAESSGVGTGILVGAGSVVRDCTIARFSVGIDAGADSQILDCIGTNQALHGIAIALRSTVRGNTVTLSGTSGIFAPGQKNRIEGNHLDLSDSPSGTYGIFLGPNNMVIRNSIQGAFIPIVDVSGPASGPGIAPLQNPATSTNPNANLSY